ncbi:MAG: hypothetical protein K6A43_02805, partial [Treponema sp.]|nr:hypothetical protein [Treponema sp.]
MENPRTLNSISTKHFDIFFTEESANSASLVADSADSLFDQALKVFPLDYEIRLVVVISPDSDELFMQYTPIPYNRIIIYDGVPYAKDFEYENTFKTLLKEQIFCAVMACVKNKFWQLASFWLGGDSLQPVTNLNIPFAFFEGAADFCKDYNYEGWEDSQENAFQKQPLNDLENYSLLVQAKLDGEFPSIFKMYGAMDSYPQ